MRQRLVGGAPSLPLDMFASVLEPVKEYTRHEDKTHSYGINTPLNRLVDSIAPESDVAREFNAAVDRYLGQGRTQDAETGLRTQLNRWSESASQVLPMLTSDGILAETIPLAQWLGDTCQIGLEALTDLRIATRLPPERTKQMQAFLDEAAKPKADMLIQIVPGVKKLVEAAGR